jgi:hypothetical protein
LNQKMKHALQCICAAGIVFISAPQSPAPIVEEPTPAPKEAKPKPTRKAQPKIERGAQASPRTPTPAPVKPFAGTWSGTMPEIPWGNVETELTVDQTESTMQWRDKLDNKNLTATATRNGNTISAHFPGWPKPVWYITPNPDGQTANIRLTAFMNDDHAVFRRVSR